MWATVWRAEMHPCIHLPNFKARNQIAKLKASRFIWSCDHIYQQVSIWPHDPVSALRYWNSNFTENGTDGEWARAGSISIKIFASKFRFNGNFYFAIIQIIVMWSQQNCAHVMIVGVPKFGAVWEPVTKWQHNKSAVEFLFWVKPLYWNGPRMDHV